MPRTVMFIDGEYLRKIFIKQGCNVHVPKFIQAVLQSCNLTDNDLLRVYFYSSPPYQGSNPTPDEKLRYGNFQKFEEFLKRQDNFEIKLGRTEKRGTGFEQKMVDVLLSIDLVELSAKEKIETAILVAGDSDFVPAVKKAKDNGVRVILFCSSDKNEYHRNLWNEADRRIFINGAFIKTCTHK
jgi:uncharacterized LabA/DUF88 family protein